MAEILTITDGTITINLLSGQVDWQVSAGGLSHSDPDERQIRRESFYSEGSALVHSVPRNVIEEYSGSLRDANHNAVAVELQNLATLQREAKQFQITHWQTTPVYLSAQTSGESNTRYALVRSIQFRTHDSFHGAVFKNKSVMRRITLIVEREPYWRSTIPQILPTALTLGAPQAPSPQADATKQFIAAYRDTIALTHIFNYDDSLTAYSANNIASTNFTYFVVSGSTPALNDAVYFGSISGAFRQFIMYLATAGSYSATVVWEFWNGSAWTGTTIRGPDLKSTGLNVVIADTITGWATTSINGVTAYWIRIRISAFTSWSTSPVEGTQIVYNPRDTHITIGSTVIDGDVEALALVDYYQYHSVTNSVKKIVAGLKSRGLTNFTSRLNAGGQNPGGWSEAYGSDTTQVADVTAPGGNRASCTFATTTAISARVTFSNSTAAQIVDFVGEYELYIRAQQSGGSAGDVSLRATLTYNYAITTDTVKMKSTGIVEIINLGRIKIIGPNVIAAGEAASSIILLSIDASALSATPDVYIYDAILMPIDEWSGVAGIDANTVQGVNGTGAVAEMDAGLIREATIQKAENGNRIVAFMQTCGQLPLLPPDKALQIHFLVLSSDGTYYTAPNYLTGHIIIYTHERWMHLRGSE